MYAADYRRHLEQFRAHLAGTSQPLLPSFIPPAGYWSPPEKDAFFHALASHSRLRPDLIANAIKSKSVFDVSAYIDVLDRAAVCHLPVASTSRSTLKAAMEVSESWVQHEEEQASMLLDLESRWEEAAERNRRSALLAARFQDDGTYWEWKDEIEAEWEKDAALAQLDAEHLRVLHRLVRNLEPTVPATSDDIQELVQTQQAQAQHSPHQTSTFDDELIDPVLLALSSSNPYPRHLPSPPREEPPIPLQNSSGPLQGDFRPSPTTGPPSSPAPNNEPLVDDVLGTLSPASRRRLKKRLHMRKKRAQTAGTEANLAAVKLVPGRKKRERISKPRSKKYKSLQRKGSDHGPSVHMQDMEDGVEAFDAYAGLSLEPPSSPVQERAEDAEEDDDDDEGRDASGDETQDTKLPNKGGVTRPYKIKSTLEGIVDTKLISANGFDVLNLTMVANFMGLFNTTYADPADDSIATAISPATITFLHGILVDFITTAVHCVISLREEEIKLKRKIKAWRLTKEDEITAENVMDALQMHGFINRSLLSDALGPSEPSTLEAATIDNTDCIEQRFVEDETGLPTRLCLHREVRPPFVSLSSDGDQSLMAIDTDTEQLSAELDEESELDNADCQKEAEYEKKLWRASLRRAKNGQ